LYLKAEEDTKVTKTATGGDQELGITAKTATNEVNLLMVTAPNVSRTKCKTGVKILGIKAFETSEFSNI
jgi:hypothetical protein